MVRVKICGITSLEDALYVSNAGADALGFIFWHKSPRFIEPEKAREIAEKLPPFIKVVGVFVDEVVQRIVTAIDNVPLDAVQLHGLEPPQVCSRIGRPVIKAFRVADESVIYSLPMYNVAAYLLDSSEEGSPGGTGKTFNWEIAGRAAEWGRIILAGGLTPENVAEAVRVARPYGVDVSSGVEKSPGRKDSDKVRRFIENVKGAI